jgi:hypothetical protein
MESIIDINIKKYRCKYFLKKNGKYIYYPTNLHDDILCLLNNFKKISLVKFPLLIGKNEDQIIEKLLILQYLKKQNFKYVKTINKKNNEKNNYYIYIFNEKNIDLYYFILYLKKIIKEKKVFNYYYGNTLKILTTQFMYIKMISPSYNNNKILIQIFYKYYLPLLSKELHSKYNLNSVDFANYNDVYLFLKKHGYVDKYYNNYSKIILKNYKKYYNKIVNDSNFEKFKNKKLKNIKNFSDLNILELVDKYVNKKFNINCIKNKFIEIIQKYNI